jgi:hypothetical protein
MVQNREALGLEGDALAAYNIQNEAFIEAAKDIKKARAISRKALASFIRTINRKNSSRAQAFSKFI